jgi:hypothetical protein
MMAGLPGHEFPRHTQEFSTENTSGGDSVLPCGPTTALLGRRGRRTMRYDATGCALRAEPLLAALFEASSPIHEDRNGLPQPIERMEVSRLPPS